jgi:hypothetical protein
MNKRFILLNVLMVFGILLTACGPAMTEQVMIQDSPGNLHRVSAVLQATDVPAPIPTIVINPTPAVAGTPAQFSPFMILLYILVAAIVLIALAAILKKA